MSVPNPVRAALRFVGYVLARFGLVDRERADRTTDLAWPRIVTGVARMSKSAADVAMVGLAVGEAAIAGVGFGGAFWGVAFALGGGVAGGTISLVSQRYGADAYEELGLAITCSVVAVLVITVPVAVLFWTIPETLMELVGRGTSDRAVSLGADYLQVLAIGVPLAGLNLIGSRALVGADDARTPMLIRGGGAVVNVGLNAVFIFGLGLGVVGAAMGTVLANVLVTATFGLGLVRGSLPLIGAFPISVDLRRPFFDRELFRDLVEIAVPLTGSNLAYNLAQFPLLFFAGLFGDQILAAYVIGRNVRNILNAPGWGFGLASSSLVGQELGTGDEDRAGQYGHEIVRFAVAVYALGAVFAVVFAQPIARIFVEEAATLSDATTFVRVSALSVVFWGLSKGATGPLRASGDTRWPFYANMLGLYGFAIPLIAAGAYVAGGSFGFTVPLLPDGGALVLGLWLVYASMMAETMAPAAINFHRFRTGRWKVVSRDYRPEAAGADD